MSTDQEYDLVVVGGGIAGLVTASRAGQLGLRTCLLEKGSADRYLCNTRFTGGTIHLCLDDIIKVTFWMSPIVRPAINDEWTKMFPDPATRPARQVMEAPMEPGVLIQCDFLAVIGS